MDERKRTLSEATSVRRYINITNLGIPTALYSSFFDDRDRVMITRWRLFW